MLKGDVKKAFADGERALLEMAMATHAGTTTGAGLRFGLLVHHTDGQREWAYDRDSHIGRLNQGLDEGPRRGWIIVNMKDDWKVIYPFEIK